MDLGTSPPEDALKILNIRKASTTSGQTELKDELIKPSTIINIPKQPKALLVEKEKEENIKKWTITNCDSLFVALQFFDTTSLKKELNESLNSLLLWFEIDEDFVNLNSREILDLGNRCLKKSIVILLLSREARKFSIFWKLKDDESLLSLKHYKNKVLDDPMMLCDFLVNFLLSSLKVNHLGLLAGYSNKNELNKIELHLLADKRGYNLLLLAVESGNTTVAKLLLESGLSPFSPDNFVSAQSIAVDANQFNVLLMLLQSNLTYPSNLDISKCPTDIQQFVDLSKILRQSLKDRETEKVKEILKTNLNLRHFYTTTNESACKFTIENNLIDMYEILLTNKVLFGPHEDVIEIMNKLDYDEKRHLREVHFNNSIDMPEKHINILMSNSYVGHEEVTNVQEKLDRVQNAFKLLNENPFIKIILLIVAASKKFRIIFDFNRDSVELIDPTAESYTAGLFYTSGRMYIGAKQLLDKVSQNEAIATIAHELCHYAMNLVYNNDANPYKKEDKESHDNVEEVSKECHLKSGTEDIVDMVYECYPEDMHHAELIVRAPHMMAFYHNQPKKLEELKEKFKGLFKLYEEKVFTEMKNALPEIEAHAEKEIAKKDKEIFRLKKRFYFAIIIFISLLFGVGTLAYINRKSAYEYRKLSPKYRSIVEKHLVIYADTEIRFNDIFESNSSAYYKLQPSAIKHLLKKEESLNIDTKDYSYLWHLIEHKWITLAKPLKNKFLKSNLSFQSENLKFQDLYENYSDSFNFLSSDEIKHVLFNGSFTVGDMVDNDVKFYVKRNFIDENINLGYHKYKTGKFIQSFEDFYNDFIEKEYEEYHEYLHEIEDSESYIAKPISLQLYSNEFKFAQFDFDEIIERVKNKKVIILSDEAGSGKTVTFKYLARYIKSKNPLAWVSYIDLKNFTKSFQNDVHLQKNLQDFLANSEFEKMLFDMSYELNEMYLLWNGFDEISSGFYNEIMYLFDYIYYFTNVKQFICTRPTYSHDLRNEFEQISFKLVPFNDAERINFVTQYISSKNNSINVKEKTIRTIARIQSLEKKSSTNDFNTPLILIMIADIGDKNNAIESANLFSIYEAFIQRKIEIWKKKTKSASISDDFINKILNGKVNLMNIFQIYALYDELSNFYTFHLLRITDLEIFDEKYLDEIKSESDIARIGILQDDGHGNLKVSHKSFVEFLVAQYLIENIYNSKSCAGEQEANIRLDLFFHFARVYGHNQWLITDFMFDYLELESEIIKKEIDETTEKSFKLDQREHNRKKTIKRKHYKESDVQFSANIADTLESDYRKAFMNLLGTDQPHIFKFLVNFFKKHPRILKILLRYDLKETLYSAIFNPIYNAYHIDPRMIIDLVKDTNVLNEEEFKMFINEGYQSGTMLLGMFHYRNEKVPKIYEQFKNVNFNSDSTICDLFNELNSKLSDSEWSDFLTSDSASVIIANYLYNAQKHMDTLDRNTNSHKKHNHNSFNIRYMMTLKTNDLNCSDFFWTKIENLNDEQKIKSLANSLTHYLEISSSPSYPPDEQQLEFLLNHIKRILKPDEILSMVYEMSLLNKAALMYENIKILFDFFNETSLNHSENKKETESTIRTLLNKKDEGIFLHDNFNLTSTSKDEPALYNTRYFVEFRQNIFYRGITHSKNSLGFNYFINLYKTYFEKVHIMKMMTESINDIFYFISFAKIEVCKEFAIFLGDLFQNDTEQLGKFLCKKEFEITEKSVECSNLIYNLVTVKNETKVETKEQIISNILNHDYDYFDESEESEEYEE